MTISFAFGPKIRIPNSQLVVPELVVSQDGRLFSNTSNREVLINSVDQFYAGDIPILGRQLLSSAYVMVNQDANTVTLWEANPTEDTNLIAVNNEATTARCGLADAAISPETSSTDAPVPEDSQGTFLTPGIVAAIVAPSVIGVGVLGLAAFCLRRRSQKRKEMARRLVGRESEYLPELGCNLPPQEISTSQSGHEMWAANRGVVHEMECKRHVHELA